MRGLGVGDTMKAIFESHTVRIGEDKITVEVVGVIVEGNVKPGMEIVIDFNPGFGMSVPIRDVHHDDSEGVTLVLECDDEEAAKLVYAMNFAEELLQVQEIDT